MKLQHAGSCGVIFQRLARVLQIAFLDRRGSRGPSRCRGSRHWRESVARRGGPRRKTEKQGEHFPPLTPHEHTEHSAVPMHGRNGLVFLSLLPVFQKCLHFGGSSSWRARFDEPVLPFFRQQELWVKSSSDSQADSFSVWGLWSQMHQTSGPLAEFDLSLSWHIATASCLSAHLDSSNMHFQLLFKVRKP